MLIGGCCQEFQGHIWCLIGTSRCFLWFSTFKPYHTKVLVPINHFCEDDAIWPKKWLSITDCQRIFIKKLGYLCGHHCACWWPSAKTSASIVTTKFVSHIQCHAIITRSIFSKIPTKTHHSSPVRARYVVSLSILSDLYSAPVSAMMYAISCCMESCYSSTQLYAGCPPKKVPHFHFHSHRK